MQQTKLQLRPLMILNPPEESSRLNVSAFEGLKTREPSNAVVTLMHHH